MGYKRISLIMGIQSCLSLMLMWQYPL